jgi:hypothetical protein
VDQLFNSTEGWYIDDIRITGLGSPPPLLQGVAQTNGQLLFSWTPISGEGYQVQFKTNLSQTNWVDLGPPITNGVVPATNAIGPDPQRFYRLQVVP